MNTGSGINNFTSSVLPAALGNLTRLRSLSFGSNNLQGTLPRELGNLTLLDQLYIDSSGLSGPIPQELSNLASLQTIWMSDNGFTGELPEFLSTFTELKDLRVEGTNLKGPIPNSFSALTKLENLRIGDLNVGESDSSLDFLENLTSLSILSLRNCQIRGPIPQRLSTFPNLTFLDLSFNKLTGQIPASFKDFSSLKYLYLGSNNIDGVLPSDIGSKLLALDVSFNPLTGNIPLDGAINTVGTSINDVNLKNQKASTMLQCLDQNINCKNKAPSNSFAVNSGGPEQADTNGSVYDDDSEKLGAASLYTSSSNKWAVSSSGVFISNINGPIYIAQNRLPNRKTLDSELYKTARIAPASLRYYGLSLENGVYRVELHFAEVVMDYDSASWEGLGRRVFDVYIQVFECLQDFNIVKEAGGSKRALIKTFNANVTNTLIDIHLMWAGKGTCCIPRQSTFGPLVSAIAVSQVSAYEDSSKGEGKRVGRIVGIVFGCVGGLVVACGVAYFWWTKKESGDLKIYTQAPKD
ncbi:probable LRR receptor-like serine/threonine-protein kinase At1g56130 [Salvia splendens]|uniref:probable LRR receptor-like serine/threonine-protein kinase At1g56130 n=1 Tax=Salvia splendens TaxID=180675 RepID=UPI001C28024F|nr:probable LRR receptor-like serine/threonine-protein kinase At1g56130 [Salvia splendens]